MKWERRVLYLLARMLGKKSLPVLDKNLRIAFPNNTDEENARLKKEICEHFATIFIQDIYLFVKKNPEKILKPIEIRNIEALHRALAKNKGVLLFSAHFGNWELIPFILSRELNTQVVSIAREMNNRQIEQVILQFREQMGSTIIYKKNSLRTMLKMLEQNRPVYLLIDQHTIEREGVMVNFFGEQVCAIPSVSQLHLKRDIPVVPLFLHYEKERIVLEIYDEVVYTKSGHIQDDIRNLTQQCTTLIEENIKKHPEQWFWFHNRWKATSACSDRRN